MRGPILEKSNNQLTKTTKFYRSFSKIGPRERFVAQKLSWVIAAILVLLPFHALLTTWAGSNFGNLDVWRIWKEVLLLLMLPFGIWLAWRNPKSKTWVQSSWLLRFFGFYLLFHILRGVWAYTSQNVNGEALAYSFIVNLRFITFFILCIVVAANHDFLQKNWQKILIIPGAVVIVFGLAQKFLLPYDFLRHFGYGKETIAAYQTVDNDISLRRIQSTLRGANPLGAYLVLLITIIVSFVKRRFDWVIVGLFAALTVLFYGYSRSAWIGLAVALIVLVYLKWPTKIKSWLIPSILSLVVIFAGFYLLGSGSSLQNAILHDSPSVSAPKTSNEVRLEALKSGLSDVISEPLGRGPGTAGPASLRNDPPPRIAENYYLQIGQEVGLAGMALFIAINFFVAVELWRRRQDQLAKILLASFIGLTFVNFFSHAWTDDTISYLWWGLAGIALAPTLAKVKRWGYHFYYEP